MWARSPLNKACTDYNSIFICLCVVAAVRNQHTNVRTSVWGQNKSVVQMRKPNLTFAEEMCFFTGLFFKVKIQMNNFALRHVLWLFLCFSLLPSPSSPSVCWALFSWVQQKKRDTQRSSKKKRKAPHQWGKSVLSSTLLSDSHKYALLP